MTDKRFHPSDKIANHPLIQRALTTLAALVIAHHGEDLECDFVMTDKEGNSHQFHLNLAEVENAGD